MFAFLPDQFICCLNYRNICYVCHSSKKTQSEKNRNLLLSQCKHFNSSLLTKSIFVLYEWPIRPKLLLQSACSQSIYLWIVLALWITTTGCAADCCRFFYRSLLSALEKKCLIISTLSAWIWWLCLYLNSLCAMAMPMLFTYAKHFRKGQTKHKKNDWNSGKDSLSAIMSHTAFIIELVESIYCGHFLTTLSSYYQNRERGK